MTRQIWQAIAKHISERTGRYFEVQTHYAVGGGCINQSYRIEGVGQNYFVKLNRANYLDGFIAEADGLAELAKSSTIRVPKPLCWGTTDDYAYLVSQYFVLRSDPAASSVQLGRQLAALHQFTAPTFGYRQNNYLGTTPQINIVETDWVVFWQNHRLGFQLALAAHNGYIGSLQTQGERLLSQVGQFFKDYQPLPSLLHGDLWSGNYGTTLQGEPIIFDPAVYYGDHETDLALTELFNGFHADFYSAYRENFPLDAGYTTRKTLYNLYHTLNHLNLFGGYYLHQAEKMIEWLLSELR